MDETKAKNAIISCHDKSGLRGFAAELLKINPSLRIFSSSGTYRELEPVAKKNLIEISQYTGAKEMPGGLIKTLHPKIHAGILANLEDREHAQYMESNGIEAFDLIVVNLYPFEKSVKEEKSFEETRQSIDIGGVSLIEAAMKNFLRVAVLVNPGDYGSFVEALKINGGNTDLKTRLGLAKKAARHLSDYLDAINSYYDGLKLEDLR